MRGQVKCETQELRWDCGVCYAVSEDGLNWTKPELGLIDFQGNKAKNLILRGAHSVGIYDDPHDSAGDRRFKIFYSGEWKPEAHYQQGMADRFYDHGLC